MAKPSVDNVAEPLGSCKQGTCKVMETGECLEGFPELDRCPYYLLAPDEDRPLDSDIPLDIEPNLKGSRRTVLESKDLYLGSELDYSSSVNITRNALTTVIVLAGANDSGKTTLLSAIFELFLSGPVAGYLFAGCETLPAFDKRCHLSRTDSGRQTEDTERTKSFSEETMLHLRVREEGLQQPIRELLLSDIRGEFFKEAINQKSEAKRIKILRRADHVAVLIDGAKLANLATRNEAATSAKTMLRSLIEAEMIGKETLVEVLFTKDDLIKATEDANQTARFLNLVTEEIRERIESEVGGLSFMRIMARSAEGVESRGVSELFATWLNQSLFLKSLNRANRQSTRLITSVREFDRYGFRRLDKVFSSGRGEKLEN